MCFEYLENPQKHLADAKKAPVLKETYDVLIERLESKLSRIDNLIYCKNEFESLCALNIEIANFNSLESYYRITKEDKRNIETDVQLKRQKLNELILLLLRSLLFESKTALIFLNSSESFYKILDLLYRLSESNREIEKVIIDFRIEDFQKIFFEKFQSSNKNLIRRLKKSPELKESTSNLLSKQNADTANNKLFDEYKSKRNEFISSINTKLEILLKNIIPRISSEIEKAFQFEEIDSDLEYSRLVIENLKKSRDRIFAGSRQKMIVKEIFWDLLPQGEWKTEGLIKTFKGYGWSKDEFDESRLTQIIKLLKPTICFIGKEKFQGYVVFGFDSTEKVVMECPKYGNAIYIIKGDWQEITKLSKWEARQLPQVKVIRHSDSWFDRLKENLDRKY